MAVQALSLIRADLERGTPTLTNLERARARLAQLVVESDRDALTRYLESLPRPAAVIEEAGKRAARQKQARDGR